MMPLALGSEDRQPNEIRLNRKGATNVPLVRSTALRWTDASASQSHRGRARGYRGPNRGYGYPAFAASSQRGRLSGSWRPSASSTRHNDYRSQTVNPSTSNVTPQAFSNAQKRLSEFSDPRQAKRPCFDNRSNEQHSVIDPVTGLSPSNKAHKKGNHKRPRIEIKVDLPLHCRKGVHGYHKSRRHWLDREIQRVEEEREVAVHHTEFLDREVRFLCYPQTVPHTLIRDRSSTGEQEHQELGIDTAKTCVNRCLFDKAAIDCDIRIIPHRQMSIATPVKDNDSALRSDIEDTSDELMNTTRDKGCLVARSEKQSSYQNPIAQSSSLGKPTKQTPSTPITSTRPSHILAGPSTSRASDRSWIASNNNSRTTNTPHSVKNHNQLLQPVPLFQRQNFSSASPELVIQPSTPHLHGFRSGTLIITSSSSVSLSSTQTHPARSVGDAFPSSKLSNRSSQNVPATQGSNSDSDSDTPLLSVISRAKYPSVESETDSQLGDQCIASSASSPEIPTTTQSQHNSGFSSASLTLPTQTTDIESIRISQDSHDRTRRILISSSSSLINVTSHGFIDIFDLSPLRHRYAVCTPAPPIREQVDDACLLQTTNSTVVIFGHARNENQISLLTLNRDRIRSSSLLDRPWSLTKKGGVSTVSTMMQPQSFVSGGYDHVVHIWTVKEDFTSASPSQLAIKHAAAVQSLLPIRDTSHKLISASADANVHIWDFSSERVVNTMKTSNSVYHAHKTSSPYCTLLEVANRELQFELRDHRLVPKLAVQRFGYKAAEFHGRFIKGDLGPNYFACGGRDGYMRLWDMRNLKVPCTNIPCFSSTQKVVQVVFDRSDGYILVASTNNEIARVKYLTDDL